MIWIRVRERIGIATVMLSLTAFGNPYLGVWDGTFRNRDNIQGTITSWVFWSDGTLEGVWTFPVSGGLTISLDVNGDLAYNSSTNIMTASFAGTAVDPWGGSSDYSGTVTGSPTGESATGSYQVSYHDPDWRPQEDSGSWQTTRTGFIVTASSGPSGNITPARAWRASGGSLNFAANAKADYTVGEWTLDQTPVQSGGDSYTLSNILANHVVTVSFVHIPQYAVVASAGANGSVAPQEIVLLAAQSVVFTATPSPGYEVEQWEVDGITVQTGGTQYEVLNVHSDHQVSVTFRPPDQDNDGMPDWWEGQYGDLQPRGDNDGDGIPNIVEFQEDLDPTLPDNIDYLILRKGWNLVAVPLAARRQTFGGFFGGKAIGVVWAWDAGELRYVAAGDDEIDPKRGVWVYVLEMCGVPLQ